MDRRNTFPASASNANAAAPSFIRRVHHAAPTEKLLAGSHYKWGTHSRPASPVPQLAVHREPLSRARVEEVVDLARGFSADSGHFGEIGRRCPLDRLEGSEMVEQRAFAGRADAGDFLQSRLADIAPAANAVRAYREAMRFVAQPLDEVEHGIARLELERLASGQEESLHPRIAIRPLGNGHERYVDNAKRRERLLRRAQLAATAVDNHEIRPWRFGL